MAFRPPWRRRVWEGLDPGEWRGLPVVAAVAEVAAVVACRVEEYLDRGH